jgi:hypothetical protein
MTRIYLTILFSSVSVAGLCLIVYGLLTRSRRSAGSSGKEQLGFSDSPEHNFEFLDLDMGHEGLKHREKERFDPVRHRPEPLSSGKKSPERAPAAEQEEKPCKIDVSH